MARGPEIKQVPVYEVIKYAPEGVCDRVSLAERGGTLLAVVPERGRGRYSLPNAWNRKAYFEAQMKDRKKI